MAVHLQEAFLQISERLRWDLEAFRPQLLLTQAFLEAGLRPQLADFRGLQLRGGYALGVAVRVDARPEALELAAVFEADPWQVEPRQVLSRLEHALASVGATPLGVDAGILLTPPIAVSSDLEVFPSDLPFPPLLLTVRLLDSRGNHYQCWKRPRATGLSWRLDATGDRGESGGGLVEAEQAQRVRVVRVLRWWLRQSADPVAEDGGDPLVTLAAWQAFQPVRAPTFLPGPLGFDDFAALLQLLSRLIQSSQGPATGRWSAVARQTPEGLESEVLTRLISFKERLEEAAGRDSLPDPLRRLVEGSALA